MRRINDEWNSFVNGLVKGSTIPKYEYQTMRRCFYAGFVTFLHILIEEIFELSTHDEMCSVLDEFAKEADDFMREIALVVDLEKKSDNV